MFRFSGASRAARFFGDVLRLCGATLPEKGVPILLKAISLLNEEGLHFKVKLVGDGPQRAEIREIIESERIADRVSLTGFLEGNELSQAMDDVSAVVMPSVCEETAGLAAIEQMMRGRLVIASDIGGLAEVVSNAGLLTPAGDAEALDSTHEAGNSRSGTH